MNNHITDETIAALEAAAKKATPGPWTCYQPKGYSFDQINADNGSCVASDVDALYSTGNGPYIAAANPQTILALIARLRAAEDDLDTWKSVFPVPRRKNVLPERASLEKEIARLTEKNKRLVEALKPFADRANAVVDPDDDDEKIDFEKARITFGQLRRARAELEE